MALLWFYRNAEGGITEIIGRVRATEPMVSSNAEEGTIASSRIPFMDTTADFDIGGHRKVYALETSINPATDPSSGVVWVGYTAEREIDRGLERVGEARTWDVQVVDINTVWERRLLLGEDCDRPEEYDWERMEWLAGTTELELVDDTTYLSHADPVLMEANNYEKQSPMAVLRDCMDQSGKNGYILNLKTAPDEYGDPNLFGLWYGHDSLDAWVSTISISNVASEINGTTVFGPAIESKLRVDPSRVYDGVIVDYDGGWVYVTRPETGVEFARRDTTLSAPNVHSSAQATLRGQRFLADVATEEHTITTAIQVTGAQLNLLREGHAVSAKFSHFPGYEEGVLMRVLHRTISEITDDLYQIDVDLSAPAPEPPPPDPFPATATLHPMSVPDHDSTVIQDLSPLGTLINGKQYRMVVDIVYRLNIPLGDGQCYAGLAATICVAGGGASPISPDNGAWTDVDPGPLNPDTFAIPGPTGTHYDGPWGTWDAVDTDFDIYVGGSVLSGFYGAEAIVNVTVEERDPP